jgi:hypothetical protein
MLPETRALLSRIERLEEQFTPLPPGWKRFELLYRDDGTRVEIRKNAETGAFEFYVVGEHDTSIDSIKKYPTPRLAAENYVAENYVAVKL